MQLLEKTILRQLFADKKYAEIVLPHLVEEYFMTPDAALIYKLFKIYYDKFQTIPSIAAIRIELDTLPSLNESQAQSAQVALKDVQKEPVLDPEQQAWLLENTEEFCQDRALYVAIQKAILVIDDPKSPRHAIPDILKDALAVSFDTHVGHDFFEDADDRWEYYHATEARIPFDLETLNEMTRGGFPKKTLNICVAGTNVGKSLFLCHLAASCVRNNKNVLYITLEMAEQLIAERIDANMMDIPIDDLELLPRSDYVRKMLHLKSTSHGRLLIKEYPTGGAHVGNFRALLQEAKMKQNFVPDVILVDYLSICSSARIKMGSNVNSYTLYKFVAEELRGLAVEFNVPVWTAAQFNRQGHGSSDPSMTDIGESWAIAQTADFMFALVQPEELEKIDQIALQPLKNRYRKRQSYEQKLLGVNTNRMKLYDLSQAQLAAASSSPPISSGGQKPASGIRSKLRRPLAHLDNSDHEG